MRGLTALSRAGALAGLLALLGALPWLSGRSPEYTVLRARYADREATPEALASVRAELGLARGPLATTTEWWGGVVRGDLGRSWISGAEVGPGVLDALAVSLTLMAWAAVVALVVAALLVAPAVRRGLRGRASAGSGAGAAALTALPEFLLALLLLVVGAVWLGWFPPYGWSGLSSVVLPALALGVPAGGLLGRVTAESVTAVFAERWLRTWRAADWTDRETTLAVLRRALPSVLPQAGLVVVGLTGGAVAVEEVFAVPGLGRATLGAASAQDLPALQAGVLALLGLAVLVGLLAAAARRALLGPALRAGVLQVPAPVVVRRRGERALPLACAAALATVVLVGLLRDPYASDHARLAPPSWSLPLGADASGRDLLARVAHGAVTTVGTAVVVTACCLAVGLLVGLAPRLSVGPVEVANAAPPVVVGIVVASVSGPSLAGAAAAVLLVSWAPLAAHTAALVVESRAQPHVAVLPTLGVGRARVVWRHLLPTVAGPVARHAALRLPAVVLALAGLGFLGLGPARPSPEWGLLLADGAPYVERAPWAVGAPALALVLVGVLAVSGGAVVRRRDHDRGSPSDVNAFKSEIASVP
ncbi:ABC transporter permease subunit [Nocardioides litoris]|uniref:ABC transporter permease subunit n=1 Tax=Nocardioides litoris TaxID=1926648 RepID=UPI0011242950|nr:ABC transporter permease subunit [Nocardioides litoris]